MSRDRSTVSPTLAGTPIGAPVFLLATCVSYGLGMLANYVCGIVYNAVFVIDFAPFLESRVSANTDIGHLLWGVLTGGLAIAATGNIAPRANSKVIAIVAALGLSILYGLALVRAFEGGPGVVRGNLREALFLGGWVAALLVVSHLRKAKVAASPD